MITSADKAFQITCFMLCVLSFVLFVFYVLWFMFCVLCFVSGKTYISKALKAKYLVSLVWATYKGSEKRKLTQTNILYIVYFILYIVYCILYIVYCILYIVYCILYIVYLGHIQGLWEDKINKIKIKDKGCCQSSSEQDPASQIFSLDFLPKTFLTVELNNYGLIGH